MQTMIQDYTNFPGDHCGSVAMRGLLHHYCGLDLPEAVIFGLGSGAANVYIKGPGLIPSAMLFGRTMAMETDLAANLGIDYRERPEADDDQAWQLVREEVSAGRPTMLSGDIFYLDYREYKVHFPGHRFVLLGFDDETQKAMIADRIRTQAEACSYGALRMSRNPAEGMSTHNLWGRFHDTAVGTELVDATRRAIHVCAKGMLSLPDESADQPRQTSERAEPESMQMISGIRAARTFAEEVPGWSSRPDAASLANFNASAIEKFGNGGGNFRRLYSEFLTWARKLDSRLVPEFAPALALEAADTWTAVSAALFAAAEDETNAKHWSDAAERTARVADLEERLFTALAETVG